MPDPLASLSVAQRDVLAEWFPQLHVVRDLSWGLVDNAVLEVESGDSRYIVKADGVSNHHVAREIDAHENWLGPWEAAARAPRLVACDREVKILVTEFVPGDLVMGSDAQQDPDTFRQAGALLGALHDQGSRVDGTYEQNENDKVLRNLDSAHRIAPEMEALARDIIGSWSLEPVVVVPTHGDWQPRNWLIHQGMVHVIDFGRAAMRPALTDWLRLAARDFRADPAREAAFIEGYGGDPRDPSAWFRERLREALNTAVWAHSVGDEAFEAEGHAMLGRVLSEA